MRSMPAFRLGVLVSCLAVLLCFTGFPVMAQTVVPVPENLQRIDSKNAIDLAELFTTDPHDLAADQVGFEGALAPDTDWIRALTTVGTMAGVQGAGFSQDYAHAAVPLTDRVTYIDRMDEAAASSSVRDFSGDYTDITVASISPDGTMLAVGDSSGVAALWDIASGTEIAHWRAHSDSLTQVLFSPDGFYLVTLGWDGDTPTIGLWHPQTAKPFDPIPITGEINSAAFNADMTHTLLAIGGTDTISLWDIFGQHQIASFSSQTDYVGSLAFSPDGRLLASGAGDGSISLWNVETTARVAVLTPQGLPDDDYGRVSGFLSFSPDGVLLFSESQDGMFRLFGTTVEPGPTPTPIVEESLTIPEPTAGPPTERCSITAKGTANLRSGPGTNFDLLGTLRAGETAQANGQMYTGDSYTWYRLATGMWVRSDLVTGEDSCRNLARVFP